MRQTQTLTSCSAFSAAHGAYQVLSSLVSQWNKNSHPFRIPLRNIGILWKMGCSREQFTLWKWTEFVREMGHILYMFFLFICFPVY